MTISALGGMQGTGLGLGVGKGRDRVSHWTNDMTRAPEECILSSLKGQPSMSAGISSLRKSTGVGFRMVMT